jgi:hypothetical protein
VGNKNDGRELEKKNAHLDALGLLFEVRMKMSVSLGLDVGF